MNLLILVLCLFLATEVKAHNTTSRISKALSPFQIIEFPNDPCDGGSRNGTCYTSEECSVKGGTSSGSCANGFGVCCLFILSCGRSTSSNNSYLVQGASSSVSNPCLYKICPVSTAVCRIRLDFTKFTIAGPQLGQTAATSASLPNFNSRGPGVGNCNTDSFFVTSPGSTGTPVICGENTGQHIYVNSGTKSSCVSVTFQTSPTSSVTRQWDIKVTQYDCAEEMGGPPGCFQYFTGVIDKITSFNFPLTATTVGSTFTHLANQNYDICIRRASGYCSLCMWPTLPGTGTASDQASFGLSSLLPAGVSIFVKSGVSVMCATDYLLIPGATNRINAVAGKFYIPSAGKVCGRQLSEAPLSSAPTSLCTRSVPFKLTVVTNSGEQGGAATSANEEIGVPGGIVGFQLTYNQLSCDTQP